MARPRVFVSSTYYDLVHVRDRLEAFVESFGFEPVLHERGEVPYDPKLPLDHSCYREVGQCDILLLILGQRYGSLGTPEAPRPAEGGSAGQLSVTEGEWNAAMRNGVPVFTLVLESVLNEFETFKRNRAASVNWVSDPRVFEILDKMDLAAANNPRVGFKNMDDAEGWLREQWAGLFQLLLRRRSESHRVADLESQVRELKIVTDSVRTLSEAMLKHSGGEDASRIIKAVAQEESKARESSVISLSNSIDALVGFTGLGVSELHRKVSASSSCSEFLRNAGCRPVKGTGYWVSSAGHDLPFMALARWFRSLKLAIDG